MLQGSIVALVTPMHTDGSIDTVALRRLVNYHIEQQTDGIVAVGTTGESATLDNEEHCEVIRLVVEYAEKRVPVIAGTGSNSTQEAIYLTREAMKAGADASLLVTPYYNKPTQEGLFLHYQAIADAVPMPHILYNVPGRTACDMLPSTVQRLTAIPNIIGIKEALNDSKRIRQLIDTCRSDNFAIYSGDDETAMESILAGIDGVISVTANVAPKAMHEMCQFALAGKRAEAEAINARLTGLHRDLFLEANPIPAKWAVQRLGLMDGGIRLPLTPLSAQYHAAVEQAMRQAQVL
jgi:4-hydroxy-tetrahydrodipicolinate synthase